MMKEVGKLLIKLLILFQMLRYLSKHTLSETISTKARSVTDIKIQDTCKTESKNMELCA